MTALETVHAIELRGITKRFGAKVVANDHIDLALDRGEILSLLGENGSGKTTLMNMLAGIYLPDEGEILMDGKPVAIRSPKDAFDHGIGMIHQHYKLVDVFTSWIDGAISNFNSDFYYQSRDYIAACYREGEICD